jgi:hypothetical protein
MTIRSKRGISKTPNPAELAAGVTKENRQLWPTPTSRMHKDNGKSPSELNRNSETLAMKAGGQLNPQWVEWLMGFPDGWTDLED